MLFLDWPSDGPGARIGLVFLGILVLLITIRRVRSNRTVARLMPAALGWHLVTWAFTAFWMLPYYAQETGADCYGYHTNGMLIADLVRAFDWRDIPWGLNTAATEILTGFIYAPMGADVYGMLFFSSCIGLCGCAHICLAFGNWATPAKTWKFSLITLFLPSLALWTGLFGKDSWIALGLGIGAYGYSSLLKSYRLPALLHVLAGMAIVTVVRPYIAFALVISMATSYLWALTRTRRISILTKIQMVVLFIAAVSIAGAVAQRFLGLDEVSAQSLEEYGDTRAEGNAVGGSVVAVNATPGIAGTIEAFPRGVVRVLFQPFPWEAHNLSSAMAAIENLFILWFALRHLLFLRALVTQAVRDPYTLFSGVFATGLLLIFSLTPNLGLLSRERTQLLPFVFGLLVAGETQRNRRARPSSAQVRVIELRDFGHSAMHPGAHTIAPDIR